MLQSSSHQPYWCKAVLASCARHCLPHSRLDSNIRSLYCVSHHSTLCHSNIYYTQTLVFPVVQCGGSVWSFPRLWGEEIFPSWSLSFSNFKVKYIWPVAATSRWWSWNNYLFKSTFETLLSHLLESSTSLSFPILQSFNSFGESSTAGAFLDWVSSNSSIIILQVWSTFLSLILRGLTTISSPFSWEVLKQLFSNKTIFRLWHKIESPSSLQLWAPRSTEILSQIWSWRLFNNSWRWRWATTRTCSTTPWQGSTVWRRRLHSVVSTVTQFSLLSNLPLNLISADIGSKTSACGSRNVGSAMAASHHLLLHCPTSMTRTWRRCRSMPRLRWTSRYRLTSHLIFLQAQPAHVRFPC